jgi:hypothetical protein
MELIKIQNKGFQITILLENFDFINLNTITNTVTIKKNKIFETKGSNFDTSITIKKEFPLLLDVNSKK